MKTLILALATTFLIGCSAGNSDSNPQSLPASTVIDKPVIYIVNRGVNALVCDIVDAGNALINCTELQLTGLDMTHIIGITVSPIAPTAYLVDDISNKVYYCDIDQTNNGQLINCKQTILFEQLNRPRPITISQQPQGNFAYIANDSLESAAITICDVLTDNSLSNCYSSGKDVESNILSISPTSVAVNPITGGLYISVFYGSPATCHVYSLTVNNCNKVDLSSYKFWATIDTAISSEGKYAYFTNYGARFVSVCHINQQNGVLEDCQDSIDVIDNYLYGVYAIELSPNNKIAYISNYDKGIVSVCNIDESGLFTACQALPINFTNPSSISIFE